jgi:hypothetical protein
MSLEDSGSWHGVLLDTKLPFVAQVIQAPAIMFYIQGPAADIDLHVFPGPTKSDVFRQLHNYVSFTQQVCLPMATIMSLDFLIHGLINVC